MSMKAKNTIASARTNYKATHTRVYGHHGSTTNQSGTYVMKNGRLTLAVPMDLRQADSVNLESEALGVHPKQVAKFNEQYGHMGVTYRPDGVAVYRDRKAKLAVTKARGFHDKQEVCG